jgi:hypothetical protein
VHLALHPALVRCHSLSVSVSRCAVIVLNPLFPFYPPLKHNGRILIAAPDHFEGQRDLSDGVRRAVDCDTQTPTHFIDKHIDKGYEFSEWALRRRALQLADLRTKKTHSMQTDKSHYRREGATQTWLPKCVASEYNRLFQNERERADGWCVSREGATQTLIDAGTNPIQRRNYVTGLRGHPEQKLKVVQLKLEL